MNSNNLSSVRLNIKAADGDILTPCCPIAALLYRLNRNHQPPQLKVTRVVARWLVHDTEFRTLYLLIFLPLSQAQPAIRS
jgi:hypothetical protein